LSTVELVLSPVAPVTGKAFPLVGDSIQGSTQEFDVSVSSPQFRTPVFLIPQLDFNEANAHWGSLMSGVSRNFYAVASWSMNSQPTRLTGITALKWDRLNLDLMCIANLNPNWDGEGAEAIPQNAVNTAATLLFLAKSALEQSNMAQCPVPTLSPAVEGGIMLKWMHRSKELKCIVLGDLVEVVRWRSPNSYESDGLWEVPVEQVKEHFEWLLRY
jgi:hypothetical protein